MGRRARCCGCEENVGTIKVPGLGMVCGFCNEVLPLVYEAETARVREAIAVVEKWLTEMEAT